MAVLLTLVVAVPVQAASPTHAFLPDRSLDGSGTPSGDFDHACGAAVDSTGNRYVASVGNDAIDIFDPAGVYFTTIANTNEPCGLAVNSDGDLYVSEAATGKVVKYAPNSYPFVGTPSYGAPVTIDSSGNAKGIAVDPTDDRLYVAEGTAVDVYTNAGALDTSIGTGVLSEATGVGAYSYGSGSVKYRSVFIADPAGAAADEVYVFGGTSVGGLKLRKTIGGPPGESFGFGTAGAYLGVDQANGHVLVYDDAHAALDEFEATGGYVTQIAHPDLVDAEPTAVAIDPTFNEVQHLTIDATGGTLTLTFEGEETTPISFNATASEVKAALEALPAIGPGNLSVRGGNVKGTTEQPIRLAFVGGLARSNVSQLSANDADLSGDRPEIPGTGPVSTVSTERQGNLGAVYATVGASGGAKLLAFGPPTVPSRPPLPNLSFEYGEACGTAVDSHGNIYVGGGSNKRIDVFDPSGVPIGTISTAQDPTCSLAVDSAGSLYATLDIGTGQVRVVAYVPDSYPPTAATTYTPQTIYNGAARSVAVNPADDHLFVAVSGAEELHQIREYDSAAEGSILLDDDLGRELLIKPLSVEIYGATGEIYVVDSFLPDFGNGVKVLSADGTEILTKIDGSDSFQGRFQPLIQASLAVDQSNGHVLLTYVSNRGAVEEYEASGAFVGQFGSFPPLSAFSDVAVDNSGGPNDGNIYLSYKNLTGDDLSAFGPLAFGEPPISTTGFASGVEPGLARLNGSVDPRGSKLIACRFDYVTQAQFEIDEFASAASAPCAESLAAIGSGTGSVPVHADVDSLTTGTRYRFRLVVQNAVATAAGDPGVVGPPLHTPKPASAVRYTEAQLNATLDSSGLATTYRFEYGDQGSCDANPCVQTPVQLLPAGTSPTDVEVPVFGLDASVTYHFRLLASNDAGSLEGSDQTFTTQARPLKQDCLNAAIRAQQYSDYLPDCRAYELVTPADTNGRWPHAAAADFNSTLVSQDGNSMLFFTDGTIPGTDGDGILDAHRARRAPAGWASQLISPSASLGGSNVDAFDGVSSDLAVLGWTFTHDGSLASGSYLLASAGIQPLRQGSLGTDLGRSPARFISPDGGHVIFESDTQLEPAAPPAGTEAVYDRSLGGSTNVVSILPGGVTPENGEDASYQGASADGSVIAFKVDGILYARRDGETVEVAAAPNTFAGFSADGRKIFFADVIVNSVPSPSGLFSFDLDSEISTEISTNSLFVNVAADGSHVYLISKLQLDGGNGIAGANNLYAWDGIALRFITVLGPQDLTGFAGLGKIRLDSWTSSIGPDVGAQTGRALSPTRTTPDGTVLVFQSHANLTSYDSDGHSEVYRYDVSDQSLLCVSCDPDDAPATADAELQQVHADTFDPLYPSTVVPNVTEDGQAVFFETAQPLLLGDGNNSTDVYEWKAEGSEGCLTPGGCLALISAGRGASDSHLYGMSPDGRDVFVFTYDLLVGADQTGASIYDARVDGGFLPPSAPPGECLGEACQPAVDAPDDPTPASSAFSGPGNAAAPPSRRRCPKSKHRVTRRGKSRCVPRHRGKKQSQRKHHDRRIAR